MKAVILAGGYGTRISEETHLKPKPLVEIASKPILWHIMKLYSAHQIDEFIICCGYKGYLIKEYFANYFLHMSDVTIDLKNNSIQTHETFAEPWKITLVDTGLDTMTGGRLKRVKKYLDDTFCMTYGDGLSNVNIQKTIEFHKQNKFLGTVTAVQPPGRFGTLEINDNKIIKFQEKSTNSSWINGGFFVFEPDFLNYIDNDKTILEKEPLENLVKSNKLGAFKHEGFWQPMDTLRERNYLEELWTKGNAPWKIW